MDEHSEVNYQKDSTAITRKNVDLKITIVKIQSPSLVHSAYNLMIISQDSLEQLLASLGQGPRPKCQVTD